MKVVIDIPDDRYNQLMTDDIHLDVPIFKEDIIDTVVCSRNKCREDGRKRGADILASAIKNGTPLEPQPKTGHWIDDCGGVKCSRCGYRIDDYYYAKTYCPNCGCRTESEVTP